MKYLLMLLFVIASNNILAETALRDDGKKVQLNADGTWIFISTDVYATSESGLRVRLKADGSWAQDKQTKPAANTVVRNTPESQYSDSVSLSLIQIQKIKEKRSVGAKSTVFKQRLLAVLQFSDTFDVNTLKPHDFSLSDSKHKNYPVVAVSIMASGQVLVQAEGAPDRWSRVKNVALSIDKRVLNTLADVQLGADFRDIKTRNVAEFGLD